VYCFEFSSCNHLNYRTVKYSIKNYTRIVNMANTRMELNLSLTLWRSVLQLAQCNFIIIWNSTINRHAHVWLLTSIMSFDSISARPQSPKRTAGSLGSRTVTQVAVRKSGELLIRYLHRVLGILLLTNILCVPKGIT